MNAADKGLNGADNVCAVVICYNGGALIGATVDALVSQVGKVLVVDNHSDTGTRRALQELEQRGVSVIYNPGNYGIASALNQGVRFALDHGYRWLLTMDQDSIADGEMVAQLLSCAESFSGDARYVSFAPIFLDDKHTRESYRISGRSYQHRYTVITSGNLLRTEVFQRAGMFEDKLFIDCVDFDFCLRLRLLGYRIVRCYEAQLFHSLGEVVKYGRFCIKLPTTLHSPERRYYILRNHIYLLKKYFRHFPLYCVRKQISIFNLVMQVLFLEGNKAKNIRFMWKGFSDGIRNRFGPL